ncbi:MAG: hypothetical protein AAFY20_02910 [Cyanobacteria bacterium J06639_14]
MACLQEGNAYAIGYWGVLMVPAERPCRPGDVFFAKASEGRGC